MRTILLPISTFVLIILITNGCSKDEIKQPTFDLLKNGSISELSRYMLPCNSTIYLTVNKKVSTIGPVIACEGAYTLQLQNFTPLSECVNCEFLGKVELLNRNDLTIEKYNFSYSSPSSRNLRICQKCVMGEPEIVISTSHDYLKDEELNKMFNRSNIPKFQDFETICRDFGSCKALTHLPVPKKDDYWDFKDTKIESKFNHIVIFQTRGTYSKKLTQKLEEGQCGVDVCDVLLKNNSISANKEYGVNYENFSLRDDPLIKKMISVLDSIN